MLRPYLRNHATQFRYVGAYLDAEFPEQLLAHPPARDPRDGPARAGPFQGVTGRPSILLERARATDAAVTRNVIPHPLVRAQHAAPLHPPITAEPVRGRARMVSHPAGGDP